MNDLIMRFFQRKLIRTFLRNAADQRWLATHIDNGEINEYLGECSIDEIVDKIFENDECHVTFRRNVFEEWLSEDNRDAKSSWIYVILDNGEDILSDLGMSLMPAFEATMLEIYKTFE